MFNLRRNPSLGRPLNIPEYHNPKEIAALPSTLLVVQSQRVPQRTTASKGFETNGLLSSDSPDYMTLVTFMLARILWSSNPLQDKGRDNYCHYSLKFSCSGFVKGSSASLWIPIRLDNFDNFLGPRLPA